MPISARKRCDAQSGSDDLESTQVRRLRRRKALMKDESDMDCWEPSLQKRMRDADGRKKT